MRIAGTVLLAGMALSMFGCTQAQLREMDTLGWLAPMYEEPLPVIPLTPRSRPEASARPISPVATAAPRRHVWSAQGQREWRYIIIHHSATGGGNARQFDQEHRDRGWDELGYHFVIDNGAGGPDGAVEVGSRWHKQKHGAHCGGTPDNEYNEHGIGICLVGNFNDGSPSPAQIASLQKLVAYLSATYDIPAANVITHQDAPLASTECPGHYLQRYVHGPLRRLVEPHFASAR